MLNNTEKPKAVSGACEVFAIVGDPIAQSLSPIFWNSAFTRLKMNAVYVPLRVTAEQAKIAFQGLQALHVSGINVTMPLKKDFAGFCNILHSPADILGAVNTVKFSDKVEGWNTDALALKKILKKLSPRRQVLILGSGASAQAVIWALGELKETGIFQIARKFSESVPEKNLELNKMLAWNKKNFAYAIAESDIIINTTPLGWKKDDFVVELEEFLDQSKIYVDLNYAPDSKLIAAALKNGCKVIDGRELLIEQGLEAFRILTGQEPPEQVIRDCIYNQA